MTPSSANRFTSAGWDDGVVADGVAGCPAAVAALHGLDGIEDHPRRAVGVDVDVAVEAGELGQLDLALDVIRGKVIWPGDPSLLSSNGARRSAPPLKAVPSAHFLHADRDVLGLYPLVFF